MKLRLKAKQPEQGEAVSYFWEAAEPVSWKAGQYGVYKLPHPNADDRKDRRFFTISAAPFEQNPRITTRITSPKGSSFKSALDHLKVWDEIELATVGGDFVMENPQAHHVFIAGGIGITPYRSILRQLDHDNQPINVQLIYANRNRDAVFKTELEELATRHPAFKIDYVLEPQRVDEPTVSKLVPKLEGSMVWVSGPEPMVEAVEKVLKKLNVPLGHIKTDYFPGYNWP